MDYLNAIIKETARLFPPLAFIAPRIVLEDHKLCDVPLKKGMLIMIDFLARQHNTDEYENPDKFDPERWMNPDFKPNPFSYLPFSAGSHNCVGQHLAFIEGKIILAEFIRRYDFDMIKGYKFGMGLQFLYEPIEPITLDMNKRDVK